MNVFIVYLNGQPLRVWNDERLDTVPAIFDSFSTAEVFCSSFDLKDNSLSILKHEVYGVDDLDKIT